MSQFYLKYNPYTVESVMKYNGNDVTEDSKLFPFKRERLQVWVDRLFPILMEESNTNELEITFHGTDLDYEDLLQNVKLYNEKGLSITVQYIPAKPSSSKQQDLMELFDEMQKGPFEDLKDQQIRENFKKALSSEFEVSVIATMSSGKSTLINSFLGREFMPSKNEACTATIVRVKDTDGKVGFSAVCKDLNGKVVLESENVTMEQMKLFNEDESISYIEVEGDVPFIHSQSVNLVLVDTPGPNNSRSREHRDHTYRIIKNDAKPLVLYVLNATQLATDDDNLLLSNVEDAMRVGGKQSKDRFIFAVNKIDHFDTERADSIDDAIANTRDYLSKFGIENPNIYLTSAEMAKVVRMHQNRLPLTRKQEKTLEDYELFNDVEQMHLTKYSPLSLTAKNKLFDRIVAAQHSDDPYDEALVHTGIPAIEEAINEYLNKYAITAKIKNAIDTFRKKVEEKQMLDSLLHEIEQNLGEKEQMHRQLQKVEEQLQEGKQASNFRRRIQNLSVTDQMKKVKKIKAKIELMLQEQANSKMSVLEVEQQVHKVVRKVQNLQSDVMTELEKLVNEGIKQEAEILVSEYKAYIQSLLQDNAVRMGKFDAAGESFILGDLPDASELIAKHKRSEREKVGEEWVENLDKRWYKPWTWFQDSGHFKDVYENREYVDGTKVFDEFFRPIRENFYDNVNRAQQFMEEESNRLKDFFINELDKLEDVIKQKIQELKELTGNTRALEQRIEQDRQKMQWLYAFLEKLDLIMEI